MKKYDVIVVGGGPAGMAAAESAADEGARSVLVIDREETLGGILRQCIHNGFGLHKLGEELTGPEYANVYKNRIKREEIEVLTGTTVTEVTPQKIVKVTSEKGISEYEGGAIVLAMGCRERSRGALNIPGTRPSGIYSAGTAQKLMNCEGFSVGNRAVILGSGDIGLIMARRMTLEGAKVEAVCELMPYSGGLRRNIVQCLEDYDIPLYLSTTVTEIHGNHRLEGVTIAEVDENRKIKEETRRFIPCDTLLLSVGLIPENELTRACGIDIDPVTSGAIVDENRTTSAEGIFACGNVLQVHDLVDYVSQEAEIAGKAAARYAKNGVSSKIALETEAGRNVRYLLPQKIVDKNSDCELFFRVSRPLNAPKFNLYSGEKLIKTEKRLKAAPGEMEKIRLSAKMLSECEGKIRVEAEETI